MSYELRFYSNGDGVVNKGNITAPWNGNFSKNNWWYDGSAVTNFFQSLTNNTSYIQYGQNFSSPSLTWATARFFGEKVDILKAIENDDGSIDFEVSVTPLFFVCRKTDFFGSSGFNVKYTVKINGKNVYNYSGSTIDEFTLPQGTADKFNLHVLPDKESTATALSVTVEYPNGEYPKQEIIIGLALKNTNPPTYIPSKVFKNGVGYSLNSSQGQLLVTKNGVTTDISKESYGTVGTNNGFSRVQKNGLISQAEIIN